MVSHSPWAAVWFASIGASFAGLALAASGRTLSGAVLWSAGTLVLAVRSIVHAGQRHVGRSRGTRLLRVVLGVVGTGLFLAATLALDLSPGDAPRSLHLALAAFGAQVWLAALSLNPVRRGLRYPRLVFPLVGHGLVILGSVYTLVRPDPFDAVAGIAYSTGFSLLFLHAYWTERNWAHAQSGGGLRGWEPFFLTTLAVGVLMFWLNAVLPLEAPLSPGGANRGTELAGRAGLLVGMAILADRPPAPDPLRKASEGRRPFVPQALAGLVLANALVLAFLLLSPWSMDAVLACLSVWVFATVVYEHLSVLNHARKKSRSRRDQAGPPALVEPVDVLVLAQNEARILASTLQANLEASPFLRFILVVSKHSVDASWEVARRLARENPDRVRALLGPNTSKAEDLKFAWPQTRSRYVLVLDADESLEPGAVERAVALLNERSDVGVVQGRKVVRRSQSTRFARFLAAERRYSTLLDHPMHSDLFGSAHFGGSAALLRREVPPAAGGWSSLMLTEDIDLTLRIHTRTRWQIVYDPEIVVYEAPPASLRELVRQRTRWGRGWNECFVHHLRGIARSAGPRAGRRKVGLLWQYVNSFSAAWAVVLPSFFLLWYTGHTTILSFGFALALVVLTVPSRLWAYAYAAWHDPVNPVPRRLAPLIELVVHSYAWVLFGWFIQFRCLYLEISDAPRTWYGTRKDSLHAPRSPGPPSSKNPSSPGAVARDPRPAPSLSRPTPPDA